MKLPEMGIGGTPERPKDEIKRQINQIISKGLENINIGSYTADKNYDGGHGEDLFDGPENLDAILDDVGNKIDLSVAENWTKEKFIQELSQMKLNFDFSSYTNLDNFCAFREKEEPLDEFIDIEDIAAMLYNE